MDAIDQLHADHDLILEGLETLEAAISPSVSAARLAEHVETLVDFFIVFLDKVHHGKEERALFPALGAELAELEERFTAIEAEALRGRSRLGFEAALRRIGAECEARASSR